MLEARLQAEPTGTYEPFNGPGGIMKGPIIVAALLLAACRGESARSADSATVTPAPAPAAASQPSVSIVAPAEGDTTGSDVPVVLSKAGVSIEPANSTRVEGIGHYHLFVDTVATAEGEVIPPATTRIIHIGTGDSTFTVKGLAAGRHEIIAVIGYGDHAAMPSRRDTVSFVVRP